MEKEEIGKKFLQSYIYTEKGNFFVSTAYRRSSAALNPDGWYYETFAWKLEGNERTDWVADHSGALHPDSAFRQHNEVAEQLIKTGEWKEKE